MYFILCPNYSKLKSLLIAVLTVFSSTVFSFNMSYVEVNSNSLSNIGCYLRSDNQKPFFNATAIFAGNINGLSPNQPEIYLNEHVQAVLQTSQINELQKKGIRVLMTLLGNHQNAGWSCMTNQSAAIEFANQIVAMVNYYGLDGVDIDDEYSTCNSNNYSLIMLTQAIKSNPAFQGKLLTMALYANEDNEYFTASYEGHHLAEYLDYGWEMSYSSSNFDRRLAFYLQHGMTRERLMIGAWTTVRTPSPYQIGQYTTQKALGGTMVFDVTDRSQNYLSALLNGQGGETVSISADPNCLISY